MSTLKTIAFAAMFISSVVVAHFVIAHQYGTALMVVFVDFLGFLAGYLSAECDHQSKAVS